MEENKIGFGGYLYIYSKYIIGIFLLIIIFRGCGNSNDPPAPETHISQPTKQPDEKTATPTTYKYYPAGQFLSEGNKLYTGEGATKTPYGTITNIEDINGTTVVTVTTYEGQVINFTKHEFGKAPLYVYNGDF